MKFKCSVDYWTVVAKENGGSWHIIGSDYETKKRAVKEARMQRHEGRWAGRNEVVRVAKCSTYAHFSP